MKRLLVHRQSGYPSRSLVGKSSTLPALCNDVILPRYHSTEKDDDTPSEIGEKARSTAEEFLRVAKEKSDEVSEGAKETFHETNEAVLGESGDEKEKFKRRVEEGGTIRNKWQVFCCMQSWLTKFTGPVGYQV